MENKDTTNTTINSEKFKGKIIITTKCKCGKAVDVLVWDDFFGETSCECGKIINAVIVIKY